MDKYNAFLFNLNSILNNIFPFAVIYFIVFIIFFLINEELSHVLKIENDKIGFAKIFLGAYFFVLQVLPSILILIFGSRRLGSDNTSIALIGIFITLILTYYFFALKYKNKPVHRRWIRWILAYQTIIYTVLLLWLFNI